MSAVNSTREIWFPTPLAAKSPEASAVQSTLSFAGAATSCYAATSPAVENHSGAYLADCNIAEPSKLACDADLAAQFYHHVLSEVKAGKPL